MARVGGGSFDQAGASTDDYVCRNTDYCNTSCGNAVKVLIEARPVARSLARKDIKYKLWEVVKC